MERARRPPRYAPTSSTAKSAPETARHGHLSLSGTLEDLHLAWANPESGVRDRAHALLLLLLLFGFHIRASPAPANRRTVVRNSDTLCQKKVRESGVPHMCKWACANGANIMFPPKYPIGSEPTGCPTGEGEGLGIWACELAR